MLGERPTLELALGTKRGPEGLSIEQGSPAEGNRVKLIEVLLELLSLELLSQISLYSLRALQRAKSVQEEGKQPYGFVIWQEWACYAERTRACKAGTSRL